MTLPSDLIRVLSSSIKENKEGKECLFKISGSPSRVWLTFSQDDLCLVLGDIDREIFPNDNEVDIRVRVT